MFIWRRKYYVQTVYDWNFNKCIPKKSTKKHKTRNTPKTPWMTKSLMKCIRRRNVLYKKSILKPNDDNVQKYKMYHNKLNISLKLAKQNYYYSQLENEKGNMRNTWKILKCFLWRSRKPLCRKFTNNGVTFTDPQQIANEFIQYFANVGPSLALSIKHIYRQRL